MTATTCDIKSIFGQALELCSSDERSRFLEDACGGDAQLRAEVEDLLAASAQANDFLSPLLTDRCARSGSQVWQRLGTFVGLYNLHKVIGEGGMGVVYLAEQTTLVQRQVALKIIKPGMDSRQVVARFEAERQVLAMMDHPHIAKVLDAGTTEYGLPYFVMELVRGVPVTDFCNEQRLRLRQRLELFVQICRAIQHAHQKGVIHRDIKPTNILVTLHDDIPIPKVIDFGVAKAIGEPFHEHSLHTAFVQMVGTPLYMSPEQANLNASDVDTRSDVYSLGVVLYELLSGTVPFDKETLQAGGFDEMRRLIREKDPSPPSARLSTVSPQAAATIAEQRGGEFFRHSLKGELDWIVMKAIEKQPERRYPTANDLAEDVSRYLSDLPIVARPSPWWLRLRKWRRRHPLLTASTAVAVLFVVLLAVGAWWHNKQLAASLQIAQQLQSEGAAREQVLRRELYATDIQRAAFFAAAGKNADAQQLLHRYRPQSGQEDLRGFEWSYLANLTGQPQPERVLSGHAADILAADVSPNHQLVASGDRSGTIKIWDVTTGAEIKSLRHGEPDQEVTSVRFSPDGKLLATAGQDRTIRLWSAESWTELQKLEKHEKTVTGVAWSPDSKRLASCGRDWVVYIWDCSQGVVEKTLPVHTDVVRCLAWSPDGKWLATSDMNRGILLWATSHWKLHGSLPIWDRVNQAEGVLSIVFSADSHFVAYGGYSGNVRIADATHLEVIATATLGQAIWSLTFLSEEMIVAGTSLDCRLVQFAPHYKTATLVRQGFNAAGIVRAVLPIQDKLVVTACQGERTIKAWGASALLGFAHRRYDERPVALAPADGIIAGASFTRDFVPFAPSSLRVWDAKTQATLATLDYERRYECLPAFSEDGQRLAIPLPGDRNEIALVDTASWQVTQRLASPGAPVVKLLFSRDGNWLAAAGQHCRIAACDTRSGHWQEVLPYDPTIPGAFWETAFAFSPTENLLAAARRNDKQITLWRPDVGIVCQRLPGNFVHALAFSPDGTTLAAETDDVVCLWDVASGIQVAKLPFSDRAESLDITNLAFSPDGRTLFGAATDNTLRLWDLASRRELLSVKLPGRPYLLQFRTPRQLDVACLPNLVISLTAGREN